MTDEQLDRLEQLAIGATPGPWFLDSCAICCGVSQGTSWSDRGDFVTDETTYADGQFIAAANPLTVLALVAEVRRLRGQAAG